MADLLDKTSLPQIVQGDQNPAAKVGPDFAVLLGVQSLVPHSLDGNVIGSDDAFLAEHIAAPAADLIAPEVG